MSGPGLIKAEEHCLRGCASQTEECSSGLVSLHIKAVPVESFAVSTNWLAPGGCLSPAGKVFKDGKHHNRQKNLNINNTQRILKLNVFLSWYWFCHCR